MITGEEEAGEVLSAVERALRLGVDLVQLRRRSSTARELEALVLRVLHRMPEAQSRLLVNDRFDVALATGVSGVHLPAQGLPVGAVRLRAPRGFRIGVSTHDRSEVLAAEREGADFAVLGPVFPTRSKPGHPGLGLAEFGAIARSVSLPVLALGGIGPGNVAAVMAEGAAGVAGIVSFGSERSLASLLAKVAEASGPVG